MTFFSSYFRDNKTERKVQRFSVYPRPWYTSSLHHYQHNLPECFFVVVVVVCLFRAIPTAYGGSQTKGRIGAIATGLQHSHSNARFEPHLWPTPQLTATPDPQPTEGDQGLNLRPDGCWSDLFPLSHNRNSIYFFNKEWTYIDTS